MVKYCKNCGSQLDDGAVFCDECGTKFGQSGTSRSSFSSNNPFKRYNVNMMVDEEIIRESEIHTGCLLAPGILVGIGALWWLVVFINSFPYFAAQGFFIGLGNPFLIIGLIWLLIRYISYSNTDLILTNKRVFGKCGLISTTLMQAPLNKIDTVSFSNGLLGKALGYGTVEIATTSSHFKFRFIRDGHTLYNDIFHQLEINEEEMVEKQANAIAEAMSQK